MIDPFQNPTIEELEILEKTRKEKEKNQAELADKIYKLTQYPEWKFLEKELDSLLDYYWLEPEFYAQKPNLAWHHSGIRFVIKHIKSWIKKQESIINDPHYDQK